MDSETKSETSNQKPPVMMHYHRGWFFPVIGVIIIAVIAFAAGSLHSRRMIVNRTSFGISKGTARVMPGGMGMRGGRGFNHSGTGTLGSLTAINGNTLTVKSEGTDQTVTVSSTTSFYKNGAIAKQSDLATGDVLTVIGTPDSSGTIAATRIDIR